MRPIKFLLLIGIAATFVEAQDQPRQPPANAQEQPPRQQPQLDKDTETRVRTERSAGGLGKVTPEERANANVGAGPHQHFKTSPAPRGAEETAAEPSAERDAGRGATR